MGKDWIHIVNESQFSFSGKCFTLFTEMDYNESIRMKKADHSELIKRIGTLKRKGMLTKIEEAHNQGFEDAVKIIGYEE
jgi:hypothetical protein